MTQSIGPSDLLTTFLKRSVPIVSAVSEKVRSEGITYPILLEVKELLQELISLFSRAGLTESILVID